MTNTDAFNDVYLALEVRKSNGRTDEFGNYIFEVEASNENLDLQNQIVLQNALMESKDEFLKGGVISYDHLHRQKNKGVYVTAVMTRNIIETRQKDTCRHIGNGFYIFDSLFYSRTSIEGLHHKVPGDVEKVGRVYDADGNGYTVSDYRQNCIYVETGGEFPETLIAEDIEYIPPFTFAILNQNLSRSDAQVVQKLNGDAVLTFPYTYDVIPAYFIEAVTACVGKEREYVPGVDFVVVGANYLKWLCMDPPEDGEGYSITYRVYPTYKVVKAIPQIRTSENQRMPKKAVIKLYDTYGEARGVNRK